MSGPQQPLPGRDFADALRAAIRSRGVTLAWLRDKLRERGISVGVSTLSQWQSATRVPEGDQSLATIDAIETVLGLVPGSLVRHVPSTTRVGPLRAATATFEDERLAQVAVETVALLGAAALDDVRERMHVAVARTRSDGGTDRVRVQTLIQAIGHTVEEIPGVSFQTPGGADYETVWMSGATNQRHVTHPSGLARGVATRLDSELRPGESRLFEWERRYSAAGPPHMRLDRDMTRRIDCVLLCVQYPPAAVPTWVEAQIYTADGMVKEDLRPTRSVQVSRISFGPGSVALAWGYD